MKNSNKMLLAVILGFFVCIVIVAVIVRANTGPLHPIHLAALINEDVTTKPTVVSGNLATKNFTIGDFTKLNVNGFGQVIIKSGDKPNVSISADATYLANIEVGLDGNELTIDSPHMEGWYHDQPINIVITTNHPLQKIATSGATQLDYAAINGDTLTLEASGSSHCYFAGKVNSLTIETSGSSHVDAGQLVANDVSIDTSGASRITVYAKNSLKIGASGMAHIDYRGNPKSITRDISGMVSINNIAE